MNAEVRTFPVDAKEIDRYARAIARIVDLGHPAGSVERERAVNTYGTAFQMLVMRRGAEYGRALALAAADLAVSLADASDAAQSLVSGDIASMHERVCVAEEEAKAREQETNDEV